MLSYYFLPQIENFTTWSLLERKVVGDVIWVQQVLLNLLSNVLEFTPEGGGFGCCNNTIVAYEAYIHFPFSRNCFSI